MSMNIEWLKRKKELLKNIKDFEPRKDRIQTTTQMVYMHNAIHESIIGWAGWLNTWVAAELNKKIKVVDKNVITLTDAELRELHEKFKDFALKFIEFDIKTTDAISKKIQRGSKPMQSKFEISPTLKDMIV